MKPSLWPSLSIRVVRRACFGGGVECGDIAAAVGGDLCGGVGAELPDQGEHVLPVVTVAGWRGECVQFPCEVRGLTVGAEVVGEDGQLGRVGVFDVEVLEREGVCGLDRGRSGADGVRFGSERRAQFRLRCDLATAGGSGDSGDGDDGGGGEGAVRLA